MVGIVTNGTMAGVMMNGMMTGVLLDGTKDGNKRMTLLQAHFHLEVWISVPTSSPKRYRMCEDAPGHRSCSEHIPTELWSRGSRRWKHSIEQPVVNGFQMVELGSFKENDVCPRSAERKTHWMHTRCCAVLQRSRAKEDKISTWDMTVVT